MEKAQEQETSNIISNPEDGNAALLRKIDRHLMIPLWIPFVFGFIDRINLGNVGVLGITEDLYMTGRT